MSDTSPKNQDALLTGHRPTSTTRTERRGEELWRLHSGEQLMICELLDDARVGAGWEIRLRKNGEPILGLRCGTRAVAEATAEIFAQDHRRTGWIASVASAPAAD
jgi:hypothetical protein